MPPKKKVRKIVKQEEPKVEEKTIPDWIYKNYPSTLASKHKGEYLDRDVKFMWCSRYFRVNYFNKTRNIIEESYWADEVEVAKGNLGREIDKQK